MDWLMDATLLKEAPFKSKAQERWMFANHPDMAKRWADHTPSIKALPEKVANKGHNYGAMGGDALEFLAEIAARAGHDPAAAAKLVGKELSGKQLVEDLGHGANLVREKGLGGAISHGAHSTADLMVRRSHPNRALGALGLGYTLPYTAHATKDRLNDPDAGPIQKAMGGASELLMNPLSANPNIGFTTAALMNVGGPALSSRIGGGLDNALGLAPKTQKTALLHALAKVAVLRNLART